MIRRGWLSLPIGVDTPTKEGGYTQDRIASIVKFLGEVMSSSAAVTVITGVLVFLVVSSL